MCGVSLTGERARSDCLCHVQDCMGGKWGSAPTLGHVEPSLAQRDPRACSKAWGMRDVCGCCDGCLAPIQQPHVMATQELSTADANLQASERGLSPWLLPPSGGSILHAIAQHFAVRMKSALLLAGRS